MPTTLHHLFKGRQVGQTKRLQNLGIHTHTHLAAMPWQPCLTQAMQARLAQEVLRSQHRLSPAKATQAMADHQFMAIRPIQLKGRAKWSSSIRPYTKAMYSNMSHHHHQPNTPGPASTTPHDYHQEDNPAPVAMLLGTPPAYPNVGVGEHDTRSATLLLDPSPVASSDLKVDASTTASMHDQPAPLASVALPDTAISHQHRIPPPLPCVVFFRCPCCPHQLPGTTAAFDTHNLDNRVWCNQCQRQLFAKLWQCSCGIPWHTCPAHQHEPSRLRTQQHHSTSSTTTISKAATTTAPRARAKRTLGQGRDTQIHQWLDLPQPERHRAAAEVELEVVSQPNLPHLKRPKLHLMGPKLLAKFPRLSQTASLSQPEPPTTTAATQLPSPLPPPPTTSAWLGTCTVLH